MAPASNAHVRCPIFSVKPDENAESHLLHRNDWMNYQGIGEEGKCARFHLTLAGDACLWYEFMTYVGTDWSKLQRLFCRQFFKLGQTQEELFQRWGSFHFDEASDTIDSYVLRC